MLPIQILPLSSVAYAYSSSDGFAKGIVLLLVVLSMWSWTIMLEKGLALRRIRHSTKRFLRMFESAGSPLDLALYTELRGPLAHIHRIGIREVMGVLGVAEPLIEKCCRERTLPRPLTTREMDKVRTTLERTVATEITELERKLGLLGTAVTVSPFLGLLGTVWGVMMAFCGMAQRGRPDIAAMAPGVSGALLTTVVGLFVAIPAVVGYNLIANAVRQTTVDMDNFVEDFIALLRLQRTKMDGDGG